MKHFLAGLMILINLLFAACSDSGAADSNSANQAANGASKSSTQFSDDVAALSLLVKLPEIPDDYETSDIPRTRERKEEAVWREEETTNPKGKKLTAVLKYPAEIAAKITSSAETHKPAVAVEIGVEDWFPEELTAQSQLSGSESLKGKSYAADDFYNAPYINGRLVRIEATDYFFLELTTY